MGLYLLQRKKIRLELANSAQHFKSINCRLVMWEITYESFTCVVKNKNCIMFWCYLTSRTLQVFCLYFKNLRFIDFVIALQPTCLLIHWTFSS